MSNISIFSGNVPANVPARGVSDLTKSIASGGSLRRIQTNTNGTFRRLVGGEQLGKSIRGEFNAIIVALLPKVGRTFYEGTYDPDAKGTLPDCWSNDGVKPEAASLNVQSTSCMACPNNVDGSGSNGKGKACRFQRRVALLLEGDMTGDAYQFNIPAKSLFGKGQGHTHPFESYVRYLVANQHAIDYVVTKIAYDLEAETMQMNFTPVRPITDEEYDLVLAAQANPDTQRLIQITVAEADGVTDAPKAAAKKPSAQAEALKAAALKAQAAAEEEDDEEEEAEEEEEEEVPFPPVPEKPAPKPAAKRAAPKPKAPAPEPEPEPVSVAVTGNPFDGDDEEEEPAPAPVRRAGPKAKAPTPTLKPELADIISDWASED